MRQAPSTPNLPLDLSSALGLSADVTVWLERLGSKPAAAITVLREKASAPIPLVRKEPEHPVALVATGGGSAAIICPMAALRALKGVEPIDVGAGRALLAVSPPLTLYDIELAIIDQLERGRATPSTRRVLTRLRDHLRTWRRDRTVRATTRSIVLLEQHVEPETRKRSRAR